MAEEITLRAYIERIESMIRQGRMDEAIAHSAHVLQYYPKNAVVYRNLGRALMRLQRHEEASEIFRRLLATVPDDFSAHYQLSIVYEQEKKGDAALWHIERAFDQQPNNAQVNDRLRDLYKKFKEVDVDKIQLTAGAVAIQYNKSGMYDEAISLLQRTLVKVPDRADLLTLLAMTQWKRGDVMDAAETALDVLKNYPYALEANRILSDLWLQEERPSDAQRYLSRVEDIDPYLAYEIATDDDVSDRQFMVEELDFSKYAASLASQEQAPDWLSNIEELAESEQIASATETNLDEFDSDAEEDMDWLTELQEDSQPIVPTKKVTDDLSDLLPDDFNFPDSAGQDDTVDTDELSKLPLSAKDRSGETLDDLFSEAEDFDQQRTGLTDLLDNPQQADEHTGLTGYFENEDTEIPRTGLTATFEEDDNSEIPRTGLTATFEEDDNSEIPRTGLTATFEEDDNSEIPRTGLTATFEEDNTEVPRTGLTGLLGEESSELEPKSTGITGMLKRLAGQDDEDDEQAQEEVDWLDEISAGHYDTGNLGQITKVLDEMDAADEFFSRLEGTNDTTEADSDSDALAWLDDDLVEDETDDTTTDVANDFAPNSPVAWLQDSGIEFDEDAEDSSIFFVEDDPTTIESDDLSPMAWLGDDDEDNGLIFDTNEFNADAEDSVQEDPMAWLGDDGVAFDDSDELDEFGTNNLSTDNEDDSMAWLEDNGIEIDDEPEFAETPDTNEILTGQLATLDADSPDVEGDPMAWLEEGGVEFLDEPELTAENDDDNWLDDDSVLDDLLNIADLTNTDANDFVDDDNLFNDTEMQDTMNDQPDWIPDDDFDSDDEFDWLVNDESGDDTSFEAQAEDDSVAWLEDSGIEIDDEPEDEFTLEAQAEDDSMAWLEDSGIEINDEPDDLAKPTGKTSLLNFLSDEDEEIEIDASVDEISEEDAFADEGADWLRALDGEEIEEAEEISEGETFADDFSDTSDEEVEWNLDQTSDGEDFDWGEVEAIDDEAELDWMAEPSAEVEDFFPSLDDNEADEDIVAEPADADWLNELEDNNAMANDELDNELPEPADADWLSELDADDEPIADTNDFPDFDDDVIPEPAKLDWLDDSEEQPVAETDDDWGELGSGFTDELDEDDETDAEWAVGSGFTDELDEDDETEFAEPTNLDWLDDNEEQSVAEPDAANWLSEIDAESSEELDEVEDLEAEPVAVAEAWDNDEEEVTDELVDPNPIMEKDDSDNWLSSIGVQETDEWEEEEYDEYADEYELNISSTTGMSDMLETIRTSREEDDNSHLEDFEHDEPEWLKQTGELISPTESDEEAMPMAELDNEEEFEALADDSSSDDEYYEEDEDYEEELEQADADNAPDWLNAMVPGLDLDFEAEDEGHLDEGFESRENTLRERRVNESETIKEDFDWLQDIVEEETGVMGAVSDEDMATTPPPTPLAPRKQYIFSSPPIWARDDSAKESIAQTVAMASEVPDYLSDFDEFEEVNEYDFDETLDDEFTFESEEITTVDEEFDDFDNLEFASIDDEFNDFGDGEVAIIDESLDEFETEFDDTPLSVEDFDFDNESTVKAKAIDNDLKDEFDNAGNVIEDELDNTFDDFDNASNVIEDELDEAFDDFGDSDFDFDNASEIIEDELDNAGNVIEDELDNAFDDFDNAGNVIEDGFEDELDNAFDDFDNAGNVIEDEFENEFDDFDDEFDD